MSSASVPTFDEVHVVSDLHLGGPPDRQVFDQGDALAGVIGFLASLPKERRVALVLNGDVVDFLAEADATYFDPARAVARLRVVRGAPAFRPVFDALAGFARAEGRTLVITIGNHDLELALPDARAYLLGELAGDDERARARIVFSMEGLGFACEVAGELVYCVHGNEVDGFNVVDQEALRRASVADTRGVAPEAWKPNGGTRLVIDVMNGIKRRYPFVDLLKPETKAVPLVLLALRAEYKTSLAAFARSLAQAATGEADVKGWLGAGDDDAALARLLEEHAARSAPAPAPAVASNDPLARMASYVASGASPRALVAGADGRLGIGGLLLDRVLHGDPRENLRDALARWATSDAFELGASDPLLDDLDARVSPDVRFLVAGHTHLERRLPRKRGGGEYLNSGTWIRLLRIPRERLASADAFAPLYDALTASSYAPLDALGDVILERRTVVSIFEEGGAARAEIRHALAREQQAPGVAPWVSAEPAR